MMINISKRNKGFTIVETLVAITVLMVAIAGPLVVAHKSLTTANLAKNQQIASYLVAESIEVVKNIRDNNVDAYGPSGWLTGISNCSKNAPCEARAWGLGNPPLLIVTCAATGCPFGLANGGYYVSASSNISLTRMFYLHHPQNSGVCANDEECGLTAEVTWYEGATPYKVRITTQITSNIR